MTDFILVAIDDEGRDVAVSQGIGGPAGDWMAFRRKPSGSLQRIKSVPARYKMSAAITLTKEYAKKKGWQIVG